METVFAIIESGVVANVIVADEWPDGINITDIKPRPGIGWSYDGEAFTPPPMPDPEPVLPQPLTKLEFLRRFTAEERIAARTAGAVDPVIADGQELLALAEFVSLDDPDTVAYVQYLEQQGHIGPGRADEILTA